MLVERQPAYVTPRIEASRPRIPTWGRCREPTGFAEPTHRRGTKHGQSRRAIDTGNRCVRPGLLVPHKLVP